MAAAVAVAVFAVAVVVLAVVAFVVAAAAAAAVVGLRRVGWPPGEFGRPLSTIRELNEHGKAAIAVTLQVDDDVIVFPVVPLDHLLLPLLLLLVPILIVLHL